MSLIECLQSRITGRKEKQDEMQVQNDLLRQMVDAQRQWIAVCEQQIEAYKARVEELESQIANK